MSIRIVTHCYAEKLPQYAQFLRYQLTSLFLYKPHVRIAITTCCTATDEATHKVLNDFSDYKIPDVTLSIITLSPSDLFRRCIGRNIAAGYSSEDVVFFTDVDHVFQVGFLDRVWKTYLKLEGLDRKPDMFYPSEIMIHKDHAIGDELVRNSLESDDTMLFINASDFELKRYNRAIGGVQIVPRRVIQKRGYLDGDRKWQRPRTDNKPFGDFRDDVAFRSICEKNGGVTKAKMPGLFRLRHSRTTYQADKIING